MNISSLLVDLKEEEILALVKKELDTNKDPLCIIEECQEGMVEIGNRFRKGEYFLPELLISGEIFKDIMNIIGPRLTTQKKNIRGTIVLGTVKGDLHDIGKDIFKGLAEANGFKVCDLGIDVPPEKFADAIKSEKAQIVGLSGLLTTAFESMALTVKGITDEGLRDQVKIIIGGGPVDENINAMVGSDAFTKNASEGVDLCKKLLSDLNKSY